MIYKNQQIIKVTHNTIKTEEVKRINKLIIIILSQQRMKEKVTKS